MRSTPILLVIAVIFVIHCLSLNFTQDDAFISYRYVENLIQGNGLVFNQGERVEGYTNFLWIILLSIFAGLGLDMILVSKILGIASGCVTLFLLHRISRLFFSKRDWWLALFPPLLLTASSAFAYWSTSGLETSFFAMMVLVSLYGYLTVSRLWPVFCALATLTRPEGGLVFGILFLHELLVRREHPRKSVLYLVEFILPVLPFVIFRMLYYGDVLPNPFYAKTGLSFDYIVSGLGYFWTFLKHYGLWGILYVVPVFFYRRLGSGEKLLALLVYLYTLYVIVIGGDVLKVHRFFLPVLSLLYLLFVVCLKKSYAGLKVNVTGKIVVPIVLFSIPALFYLLPHKWIHESKAMENALVEKMRFFGEYFKEHYGSGVSLAVTTIGSISYYAGTEIRVIDMLGLTDKYISRHPEEIEGIAATWKERRYNTGYLLSLDPDFILFSTGYKPSAPAERALLLNSKFRQNYYVIPIIYPQGEFSPIFKRKGFYSEENEVFGDAGFIDLFCEGVHMHTKGRNHEAIKKLKQAALAGPQDFALVHELLAGCNFLLDDYPAAESHAKKAIEIEDCSVLSHVFLMSIYVKGGRVEEAKEERSKIYLCDPNFLP